MLFLHEGEYSPVWGGAWSTPLPPCGSQHTGVLPVQCMVTRSTQVLGKPCSLSPGLWEAKHQCGAKEIRPVFEVPKAMAGRTQKNLCAWPWLVTVKGQNHSHRRKGAHSQVQSGMGSHSSPAGATQCVLLPHRITFCFYLMRMGIFACI